jgi:hypothetical protein
LTEEEIKMNDSTHEPAFSDRTPDTSKTQNMIKGAIAVGTAVWAIWKGIRMVTERSNEMQPPEVSEQEHTFDYRSHGSSGPAEAINIETLINQAYERMDSFDWSRWVPEQGDQQLTTRMVMSKPPLTLKMVVRYLSFYAWVWEKVPPPEEVERVKGRLIAVWMNSWVYMDDAIMREVLVKDALWVDIVRLPPQEQETIRTMLRRHMPEGVYSELESQPTVSTGTTPGLPDAQVEKRMRDSQLRASAVQDVLRQMTRLPH